MIGEDGFAIIHRKILKSAIAKRCDHAWPFIWLVLSANWERRQLMDGTYLERGQLRTSRERLAKAWGLTEKQVRGRLIVFQNLGMITAEKGPAGTTITVCNYSLYQDIPEKKGQQRANKGPAKGQRRANEGPQNNKGTIKQGNKVKRDRPAKFLKPTIEQVEVYWTAKGLRGHPNVFYDHYESNGWKVGKNSMKDWEAAARGWASRERGQAASPDDPTGNLGRLRNIIESEQNGRHNKNGDGRSSGGDVPAENVRSSDQALLRGFGGSEP